MAFQLATMYVAKPHLQNEFKSIQWMLAASNLGNTEAECNMRLLQNAQDESFSQEVGFACLDELWEPGKRWYFVKNLPLQRGQDCIRLANRGNELIDEYSQRH